jgi:hypothetical protein
VHLLVNALKTMKHKTQAAVVFDRRFETLCRHQ